MLRRTGVAAGAAAMLALLAGCVAAPDRGDSRPPHLALGVPAAVVLECEQSVGLGDAVIAPTVWRDSQGVHVRIGHGTRWAVGSGISNTESALLSCLNVAAGPDRYPSDRAALLLLWKYSASVLWPCLADRGIDVGPVPSREAFLSGDPLRFDPFDLVRGSLTAELGDRLREACPPVPAYLKETAG